MSYPFDVCSNIFMCSIYIDIRESAENLLEYIIFILKKSAACLMKDICHILDKAFLIVSRLVMCLSVYCNYIPKIEHVLIIVFIF